MHVGCVDVDTLLSRAQKELRTASGGPFVAAAVVEPLGGLPAGVDSIATDVGEQVERWEALKRIVRVMPFSAPLDQYQIASGFGTRSDPINGRRAMHTGLDFNAPVKTPVLSTAPGRVVFAGWHGEYGRLVEIDRTVASLDAGRYGVCERCGRPIAPERLAARPTATTCVPCASA